MLATASIRRMSSVSHSLDSGVGPHEVRGNVVAERLQAVSFRCLGPSGSTSGSTAGVRCRGRVSRDSAMPSASRSARAR